jgi:radical SAM protein with 4Fe4S-binding SPASM domain
MAKISPYAYGHLPLYFYLAGAYSRFLTAGKCLDFPIILLVQTQSFCNGRCSICPYPTVSKKLPQGRMEWDLFKKIADEAAAEPLSSTVVFELHNEPLLDERIFNCVKYIKSVNASKRVAVVTNGELLDRFSPEDIVQSNLDSLSVSLNAYSKEMYESINTGLNYEKVMDNISRILSNPATRKKTTLTFVLTGSLGSYEKISPGTGYQNSLGLATVWRRLMNRARHVVGCHVPFYQMSILFNGDVLICSEDWNRTTVLGNVAAQSLKEIWNSEKANENRRLLLKKKFDRLDSCKGCSLAGCALPQLPQQD